MNTLKSCHMKTLNVALLMYVLSLLIPVSASAGYLPPDASHPQPPPEDRLRGAEVAIEKIVKNGDDHQ